MKFNLDLNPAALLSLLNRSKAYLVGAALIGVFGYTGWVVNQAFNVQPAAAATATGTGASTAVRFDKATINDIKQLQPVKVQVNPSDLGKPDPFGQ